MRSLSAVLSCLLLIGLTSVTDATAGTPLDPLLCPDSNGKCEPVVNVVFPPKGQCTVSLEKDLTVVLNGNRDLLVTFRLRNSDYNRRASFDAKAIRFFNRPSRALDLDDDPSNSVGGMPLGRSPDGQTYTLIARNRQNLAFGFKIYVFDTTGATPLPCRLSDPTIANQG